MTDTKLGIVVRSGRKTIKSAVIDRSQAEVLLVSAFRYDVTKALMCFPTLKLGKKFKFKHSGLNVTFEPLVAHIDNY